MDPIDRAKQRLQADDGEQLRKLAAIVVEQTTATPIKDIATPRWIAGQIATALEAATRGDAVRDWVDGRIQAERERWSDEERTLRHWLPDEAEEPLRKVLGRVYSPDEDLTFQMIDHDAVRNLVRGMLTGSLRRFGKKLRSVGNVGSGDAGGGVLGGLGGRAARRGKKLFGGVAENWGGLAENLVGAVKDELDQAMEGRVRAAAGSS